MRVRQVPLDRIVLDQRLQVRHEIDQRTVEEYRAAYRNGAKMPPLEGVTVDETGTVYLTEGWHRFNALLRNGESRAPVIVIPSTWAQAKLRVAGTNATHGLRRKQGDAPHVIQRVVEGLAEMSDEEWEDWKEEKAKHTKQFLDGWTYEDIRRATGYVTSTVILHTSPAIANLAIARKETLRQRGARGKDDAERFDWDAWEAKYVRQEPTPGASPRVKLLQVANQVTGKELGSIRAGSSEDMAQQAHELTVEILSEALKEKTMIEQISEAESLAFSRAWKVDLVFKAINDMLVVTPPDMLGAWGTDKRQKDLADWLERMAGTLTDYAAQVRAVQPQRLWVVNE